MKNTEVLGEYFCKHYSVNPYDECKIEYIDPMELLVPDRLDLVAKLIWIHAYMTKKNTEYANYIYAEHIRAMTDGTCIERGQENVKNSLEKYISSFRRLIEDISVNGFKKEVSAVPVGDDNTIMDGAHRTAIGIYFGIKIPIVRIPGLRAYNNAAFFLERFLDNEIVGFLVQKFCQIKKNSYAICIWPRACDSKTRKKTEDKIRNTCEIIYRKEVCLNAHGLRNLMIQIYREHDWMGSAASHFKGASSKSEACWKKDSTTVFYFVLGPELSKIQKLKSEIRELFNMGNHSVHITDWQEETLQIAGVILNTNSRDLLNKGYPDRYVKLNLLVETFKNRILAEEKDLNRYILDSGAVIGLYGLRETNDLDYLTDDCNLIDFEEKEIEEHSSYLKYHNVDLNDLIYNPKYYLYYNSVKFISLEQAKVFKKNRGEKKDLDDVRLINNFQLHKFSLKDYAFKISYLIKRNLKKAKKKLCDLLRRNSFIFSTLKKIQFCLKGAKRK